MWCACGSRRPGQPRRPANLAALAKLLTARPAGAASLFHGEPGALMAMLLPPQTCSSARRSQLSHLESDGRQPASHANKGSAPHASRSPTGPATPSHVGTSNAALGASASGRRAHHPSLPKHCELTRVSRRKQPQAALAQDRTPPRCRTRLSWCLSQPRPGARDRRDAAALPTDRPRRHRRPVPDPASGTDRYKCGRVASMARPSGADAA